MEIFHETIDRELPDLVQAGRAHALHRAARPGAGRAAAEDGRPRGARPPTTARLDLWIAFDYGGRAEIVDAARRLVEDGVPPAAIDEEALGAEALRAGASGSGSR